MAWSASPIGASVKGSAGGSTVTTDAVDITGADTIIAYLAESEPATDVTLSDTLGSTYVALTSQSDVGTVNLLGRMFYAKNVTGASGFQLTATDNGGTPIPSVAYVAFSGGHLTAVLDQQNGVGADLGAPTTRQIPSITPSGDGYLVVTGLSVGGNAVTLTIDGSYTISGQVALSGGAHFGLGLAWWVQTTATATSPTWTGNNNMYALGTIASFIPAAGGGGGGGSHQRSSTARMRGRIG